MFNDPFEFLSQAGDHSTTWILIYGPLGVVAILSILATLWVRARRNKERKELETVYRDVLKESPASSEKTPAETSGDDRDVVPFTATLPNDVDEIRAEDKGQWLARLRAGLTRTREAFGSSVRSIFSSRIKIDDEILEKLHEVLYRSDVGVKTADRLIAGLKNTLGSQEADWSGVKEALAAQIKGIFSEATSPLQMAGHTPFVILVIGVNGVGKTTTIGKLAARFKAEGKSVMLCAADTFRAAAIEQLQIWGERNDVPVIKQHAGADPAAVAFDGVQAAKSRGMDVLIIDTAGRLHSKTELMAELSKINKSIGKDLPGAPHETWIVLDATTGQNAVQQCKAFSEVTSLSGIVMTKLDGTAKGGVIIGIADQFKLPIRFIGVGEKASDLKEFRGEEFVEGLF